MRHRCEGLVPASAFATRQLQWPLHSCSLQLVAHTHALGLVAWCSWRAWWAAGLEGTRTWTGLTRLSGTAQSWARRRATRRKARLALLRPQAWAAMGAGRRRRAPQQQPRLRAPAPPWRPTPRRAPASTLGRHRRPGGLGVRVFSSSSPQTGLIPPTYGASLHPTQAAVQISLLPTPLPLCCLPVHASVAPCPTPPTAPFRPPAQRGAPEAGG